MCSFDHKCPQDFVLHFLLYNYFGICRMCFSHQFFYLQLLACQEPPPRRVKEVPTERWDKPPYPHGTQVTYRCRPGYIKLGRIVFECADGVWEQRLPVIECRNKPCGHPGDIEFGSFELTSGTEFVFGARVLMLKEINCDVPKIPHGYIRSPKRLYKESEQLQFFCDEGYRHGERADAQCTESGWNPIPYCTEIVCSPPIIPNGNFRPQQDSYVLGDIITVQCNTGYHFKTLTGKSTAECTRDGWVPVPGCVQKPCDYPAIENGKLSESWEYRKNYYFPMRVGQYVDYHCANGYSTPSGHYWVRIVCSGRGWSPEPKCLKICDARQLENGYFSRSWKDVYREGERVKYVCNADYQTEHEGGEVTCAKNGWSPPPRCIRKSESLFT
uniref:Sushi domain-containing protein n=1 Tax=Strix occidentalis caurina TaxID=311401 RepID=A0A8D0EMF2_STROC